jgi:hypothetical protein
MSRAILVLLVAAAPAAGQQFPGGQDTFDNGQNAGGWSFPGGMTSIEPSGGNCDGYLRGIVRAAAPVIWSAPGTSFSGNYDYCDGPGPTLDLRIESVSGAIGGQVEMLLVSVNGTPVDPSDDWGAYGPMQWSQPLPAPGGDWTRYGFGVGCTTPVLPAGWSFVSFGPNSPVPEWLTLLRNVDRLGFVLGDLDAGGPELDWVIGMDNVGFVGFGGTCYANCDQSTASPFLNVNDFVCFSGLYAAGDPRANCDGSTRCAVLNVNDFICFQSKFAAGCSAP